MAWQMWDAEALEWAKQHNRVIFLSIGYSACHCKCSYVSNLHVGYSPIVKGCHVMEHESFCSSKVADVLNASFVPIKVDREERPDIDAIYMNFVQATTGGGGWPMSVFLTPDLEPIFGGTYFPGPDRVSAGRGSFQGVTFLDILEKINLVWLSDEKRCRENAKDITRQLKEFAEEGVHSHSEDVNRAPEDGGPDLELLEEAYQHFQRNYDREYGGFSKPPKFPTPAHLSFLIRLHQWPEAVKHVVGEQECDNAVTMVVNTLRHMARGGIRDQIGYGFSRYSVTKDWKLPHFEKMLYDQAQLLHVYLDAFLVTKDPEMLGAVLDIATYLTSSPIMAERGGFFSAEDADSYPAKGAKEKREGAYYVWSLEEIKTALGAGETDAGVFTAFYGVKENGNILRSQDPHDEFIGQNVLTIATTPGALAGKTGLKEDDITAILKESRRKLREYRELHRPRPALDDKIIVAWNGLAIGALARTYGVLKSIDEARAQDCKLAAERAVAFIQNSLYDNETQRLWRVYREGRGDAPGFCDDYAFLIQGLIDMYEATFEEGYLQFADTLQSKHPCSPVISLLIIFLNLRRDSFLHPNNALSFIANPLQKPKIPSSSPPPPSATSPPHPPTPLISSYASNPAWTPQNPPPTASRPTISTV